MSKGNSWRREHKRSHWLVTIKWQNVDLDGQWYGEDSVTYRFPGNYTESNAYEAAEMRWADRDWTPSEYDRACRSVTVKARLIRECDHGLLITH